MGITSCCQYLKDTLVNREERHIEGTATEIINNDLSLFFVANFVKTVCNGSGGRLVNDSEDSKTSDCACVFRGLTLSVVEVGGDCDNSVGDLLSDVSLSDFLHLSKDHG